MSEAIDLDHLYATARRLKDSVYRQWINNLSQFMLGSDPEKCAEAVRRAEYIETRLLRQ